VAVLLSIPLYLLGLKLLGTRGVALAASLSAVFQVFVLYVLWNRRTRNAGSRDVYRAYLKIIFVSIVLGLCLVGLKQTVFSRMDAATFGGSLQIVLVTGIAFAALMLLAGYVFRIKEIREVISRFIAKLRGSQSASE
jgi:putative peptidoglycan lipid II flippase